MPIRAFVFDAYGTLFDVQSVLDRVEAAYPGHGELITQVWRLKQLEYTWLRTCMDSFADFAVVTHDSLAYAIGAAGLELSPEAVSALAQAYLHLTPALDARETLQALEGRPRAIFSNGSVAMLDALVANTGVRDVLDHVISVDAARAYKPSPKAYALVEATLGIPPADIMFVSSNGFDVVGAKRFGFQVAWIRRPAGPAPAATGPTAMYRAQRLHAEILNAEPDHVLPSLRDLVALQ